MQHASFGSEEQSDTAIREARTPFAIFACGERVCLVECCAAEHIRAARDVASGCKRHVAVSVGGGVHHMVRDRLRRLCEGIIATRAQRAPRDGIGASLDLAEERLDPVRRRLAVIVGEAQHVRRSSRRSEVSRRGRTPPIPTQQPSPRKARHDPRDFGAVARYVVDDDHLERRCGLKLEGRQAFRQLVGAIAGRDHHRCDGELRHHATAAKTSVATAPANESSTTRPEMRRIIASETMVPAVTPASVAEIAPVAPHLPTATSATTANTTRDTAPLLVATSGRRRIDATFAAERGEGGEHDQRESRTERRRPSRVVRAENRGDEPIEH